MDEYLRKGAGPLKNKASLTPHNIFHKAAAFHKLSMRAARRVGLHHVLKAMLQTGKYYPSANWIMPVRPYYPHTSIKPPKHSYCRMHFLSHPQRRWFFV